MFDKFGTELKPGDKVIIEAQVVSLYHQEPCINLKVRLLEPRPASDGSEHRDAFYIHSRTVRKLTP